jgi:ABC-type Mn2+/Zn2+ transport system ATPase subunit/ABC-type Zn uptake system ZnuABC Zn-binding protein ZnuA
MMMATIRFWLLGLTASVALLAAAETAAHAHALPLNVVTSFPQDAAIVQAIGGPKVSVTSLAKASKDPHAIQPKPSMAVALNRADLLVTNGQEMELSWLPIALANARNSRILEGASGYFDPSVGVNLLPYTRDELADTPFFGLSMITGAQKAKGGTTNIHFGNHHYWLDPANGIVVAHNVASKLAELDPADAALFRANANQFDATLRRRMIGWDASMKPFRGMPIVSYHRDWIYLIDRHGLHLDGYIEPRETIPPGAGDLALAESTHSQRSRPPSGGYQRRFALLSGRRRGRERLRQYVRGDLRKTRARADGRPEFEVSAPLVTAPLVSARTLQIGYRGCAPLLAGPLDLQVAAGSAWAIVGPNGAGKTTLLRTLLGLLPALAGNVERAPGLRVGYVPQRAQTDPTFPATACDIVLMGRLATRPAWHRVTSLDRTAALAWLERVGVGAFAARPFRALSGGQRQRVLMARALALEPSLLVLDEPTDGLDLAGEADLLTLVASLRRESGVTVLLVTHALHQVAGRIDHLLILRGEGGQVEAGPATEMLTEERLSRLYGRRVVVGTLGGETVIAVPHERAEAL